MDESPSSTALVFIHENQTGQGVAGVSAVILPFLVRPNRLISGEPSIPNAAPVGLHRAVHPELAVYREPVLMPPEPENRTTDEPSELPSRKCVLILKGRVVLMVA